MKFKVGDKVDYKNGEDTGTIIEIKIGDDRPYKIQWRKDGIQDNSMKILNECTLIKSNNLTKNNMDILQTLKMALKGEPEKTFIQTGIMDENENLTDDGKTLFLGYLLKKHKDDFNTKIVSVIKAEQDKAEQK